MSQLLFLLLLFFFFFLLLLAINGYHVQVQVTKVNDIIKATKVVRNSRFYNHERALNGLLFISGLRGLSGRANRSSSSSRELRSIAGVSPCMAAFNDMACVRPLPREMAEKEDTAISPPDGDNVCDGTSAPVNVFAVATCQQLIAFPKY